MMGVLFWLCVAFVAYVYAGYPVLLAVLARLRQTRPEYPPTTPAVTLLIAAYNEEAVMASKIENCLAIDYPPDCLQILVAADGSDDRTVEIVRSNARRGVELSFEPARSGKMQAINRAMSEVRNEIVVFSDANNMYRADTVRELVKPFADPRVGAVSGRKSMASGAERLGQADGTYWGYESFIKAQEDRLGCCAAVSGEVFAIRKSLFAPPPVDIINDDFYMALDIMKQGYRVAYAPRALSFEAASGSEADEMVRRSRIVAGRLQVMARALQVLPLRRPLLVWQIVSHKFLRPLVPAAALFAFIATALAAAGVGNYGAPGWLVLAYPYNLILLALQLGFYLLALAGAGRKLPGITGKLLYLPAFLINSNIAALRGLYGFVSRRQTVIWKKAVR